MHKLITSAIQVSGHQVKTAHMFFRVHIEIRRWFECNCTAWTWLGNWSFNTKSSL